MLAKTTRDWHFWHSSVGNIDHKNGSSTLVVAGTRVEVLEERHPAVEDHILTRLPGTNYYFYLLLETHLIPIHPLELLAEVVDD